MDCGKAKTDGEDLWENDQSWIGSGREINKSTLFRAQGIVNLAEN